MTHIYNDSAEFAEEALEGFTQLYSGLLRPVPGGVVSRSAVKDGAVTVVVGGGSGHYPMFAGLVGPGLADGAVVGNIFTSPSAQYAYSVAARANRGGGVVFCYGNYAGDVMNFGIAEERLNSEGIPTRSVIVRDDVLSASNDEREKRRGLAGDFVVLRALAGAAAAGKTIDEVVQAGEKANARTRTVGVAFAGCTFPGADHALFEVPDGKMAIGLGVHGEPGLENIDAVSSKELARILFEHVTSDLPEGAGDRVGVIVNGLGATKAEEMFVLWRDLQPLLADRGYTAVDPEVGEIITSLDMAGLSLTLVWLDDELEGSWTAPAYGPGYRKGSVGITGIAGDDDSDDGHDLQAEIPPASADSRAAAATAVRLLNAALGSVRDAENELADADAVAGDGDHGRGMVRGLEAAVTAAATAAEAGAGLSTTLKAAGDAWGEHAGGTSGVLWGAALRSFGAALDDERAPDHAALLSAATAFEQAIRTLGRVELGDKTMLDSIAPTVESFREPVAGDGDLAAALRAAAERSESSARSTAELSPKVGRARPLAERSIGHPDPGALSFSIIVRSIADAYSEGQS